MTDIHDRVCQLLALARRSTSCRDPITLPPPSGGTEERLAKVLAMARTMATGHVIDLSRREVISGGSVSAG